MGAMLGASVRVAPIHLVAVFACACAAATADADGVQAPPPHAAAPATIVPAPSSAARPEAALLAGVPEPPPGPPLPEVVPAPRLLRAEAIREVLRDDPGSLGSLSVGRPNRGALVNPVVMPEGPLWHVVEPKRAFGTAEAVRSLMTAIRRVEEAHPGSPRLHVGHLSSPRGGYLRPHRSHQSGRDVDLGFYYRGGERWYARATAENLDLPRTWALVRAFIDDPNVEMIIVDRAVQRLLRDHAESIGEAPQWLDTLFQKQRRDDKLIRHEWGHLTHLHVRFRSEEAQAAGALAHRELVASRKIPQRRYY
jgi:penicillin-insensitive murein endopeptidase